MRSLRQASAEDWTPRRRRKIRILCVITSVSLDHVQYLGNTIREIAGEKAGILVKGVPCVLDGNDGEALLVLREKARMGAPFRDREGGNPDPPVSYGVIHRFPDRR